MVRSRAFQPWPHSWTIWEAFETCLKTWSRIVNSEYIRDGQILLFLKSFPDDSKVCARVLSHVWVFATLWTVAQQAALSMGFSRQEHWVGSRALLQGIFPTQGSNPGLLHWQEVSLPLHHLGSPRIFLPYTKSSSVWITNFLPSTIWICSHSFYFWPTKMGRPTKTAYNMTWLQKKLQCLLKDV